MFRKALIAAALAVATLTTGVGSASASDLNSTISNQAPITQAATTTDSAAGFKGGKFKFKFKRHFKHFKRYGFRKNCFWYKKKYHRTGNYFWLKKYQRCVYRKF